ncbi:MAG: LuxR family transcriptional regulator, partial [Sphingobacteriaceae bacterium]
RNQEGKLILINQKLTPIFFNDEGKIWKALCVVSLSSERTEGNIRIHKSGENKVYTYDLQENVWRPDQKMKLSDRETEILQLSVRGHTINEISEMLFVSPDTIKFHRRKLFEKMGVNSMTEAISYAVNNNLNIFWQVKHTKI